ncbi:helix-turn-helix domain-containing protein [Rhodospirillaceae bacterium SYSU D60014]|uniref:helix-turn-helix domain-containing protein n=1 Tax=Virgifigura deserti TaxID=2268457 RepID=UPI000E66DCBC
MLLEVSVRPGRWDRPPSPLALPMPRGNIADDLGLTVETVSRCFTRFKGGGCIALPEPASVELIVRQRQQDLASGDWRRSNNPK